MRERCKFILYFLPIKGEKGEVGPPGQRGGAGEPALNVSVYAKYFYKNVHLFIMKATLFCCVWSLWFLLHHCKTDKFGIKSRLFQGLPGVSGAKGDVGVKGDQVKNIAICFLSIKNRFGQTN